MSRENVENHRMAIEAFNRRDFDALLTFMDAEVEFSPFERAVEGGGAYRGHHGVRRWLKDALDVLPDFRLEIDELLDLGDRTLVHGRLRGQGAASGASFERAVWHAVEWQDDKQVWWYAFETEAEALEAVRLRESP